jgi:hypothetical protein
MNDEEKNKDWGAKGEKLGIRSKGREPEMRNQEGKTSIEELKKEKPPPAIRSNERVITNGELRVTEMRRQEK